MSGVIVRVCLNYDLHKITEELSVVDNNIVLIYSA